MYKEIIQSELTEAEQLFETAQEATYKPEEDMNPYMVCHNAHDAVKKYLISFLLQHEVEANSSASVVVLLEKAQSIDPQFEGINLDLLALCGDPDDVWMEAKDVNNVMKKASTIRELVKANQTQLA